MRLFNERMDDARVSEMVGTRYWLQSCSKKIRKFCNCGIFKIYASVIISTHYFRINAFSFLIKFISFNGNCFHFMIHVHTHNQNCGTDGWGGPGHTCFYFINICIGMENILFPGFCSIKFDATRMVGQVWHIFTEN